MKRQRNLIEEDLEDEASAAKRKRMADDEPDVTFLERVYTYSIMLRVRDVESCGRKARLATPKFGFTEWLTFACLPISLYVLLPDS